MSVLDDQLRFAVERGTRWESAAREYVVLPDIWRVQVKGHHCCPSELLVGSIGIAVISAAVRSSVAEQRAEQRRAAALETSGTV